MSNQSTAASPIEALRRIRAACRCEGEFERLSGRGSSEQVDYIYAIVEDAIAVHEASLSVTVSMESLLIDELSGPGTLDGLFDALLTTCIEDGSNSWCARIAPKPGQHWPSPDELEEHHEERAAPGYCVAFQAGREMVVNEKDEDGELDRTRTLTLDRVTARRGLRLMAEHYPGTHFANLIREKAGADASLADVWLQLAVLGEIVYG